MRQVRTIFWRQWSLTWLLWSFIIILIAGGWAAVVTQARWERTQAERAAVEKARIRAIVLEQHVLRTLQAASLASVHLGYEYLVKGDVPLGGRKGKQPFRITDPVIDNKLFAAAGVVDSRGRLLGSTAPPGSVRTVAGHPVYQKQMASDTQDLIVSGPHHSWILGDDFIYASRNIMGAGRRLGYVSLQIAPDQLLNFPRDARFDKFDLVSVITLDGISLSRRTGDLITTGEDLRGTLVMQRQRRWPNGSYIGPSALDGHVRYFVHRRLADYPIFVTAGISRSETLAPVEARARIYYIIMAALSLISGVVAFVVGKIAAFRARSAAQLSRSYDRLAEAQRVGLIGDWEYDYLTGNITWSENLCRMYERPANSNSLTLQDFSAYVDRNQINQVQSVIDRAQKTGEPQQLEFKVYLPSGVSSQRSVNAVPVRDASGKVTRLYGTDQDISQKLLLQSLNNKVAHFDRQQAMSTMASTLAHEINQSLAIASNYIGTALHMLRTDHTLSDKRVDHTLTEAYNQIFNIADIIRRVREMVSGNVAQNSVANLSEVISNTVTLVTACGIIREGVVDTVLEPEVPDALIDPIQLQQVLVNLVKNAVEAFPSNALKVSIHAFSDGPNNVRIEVIDNGPGFKQEQANIFSPLSSDKEHGLGLGLSISRTIVEYHQGELSVSESRAGRTALCVRLKRWDPLSREVSAVPDKKGSM